MMKMQNRNTLSSFLEQCWMDQTAHIKMREEKTKWEQDLKPLIVIKTELL
jgi:hypothetical protein